MGNLEILKGTKNFEDYKIKMLSVSLAFIKFLYSQTDLTYQ